MVTRRRRIVTTMSRVAAAVSAALDSASWRVLVGVVAAAVGTGVAAALAGFYALGFVAIVVPLAALALSSARRACVLVALASPVVALGSVDLGFHLVPSYPLIAAGVAGLAWRREWMHLRPTRADYCLLAFIAVAAAVTIANLGSAPASTVLGAVGANAPPIRPLAQLLALLAMAGLYLLLRVAIRNHEDLDAVLRALLIAAAFVGVYAGYQVVGRWLDLPFTFVNERRDIGTLPSNVSFIRPNSTLSEASVLAQFSLIPLFLGLAWMSVRRQLPRWLPSSLPALVAAGAAATVFSTLSKIALLACAIWLPILIVRVIQPRAHSWLRMAGVTAVVLSAVAAVMVARAVTISTDAAGLVASERYVRGGYWIAATRIIADHPLGVGIGNFPFYYPDHAPLSSQYEYLSELADAHNLFLELAAETGLIGGALFVAFVVALIIGSLQSVSQRPTDYLSATATGLTLAFAAGVTMHLTYSYFYYPFEWVLAGLVGAMPRVLASAPSDVHSVAESEANYGPSGYSPRTDDHRRLRGRAHPQTEP